MEWPLWSPWDPDCTPLWGSNRFWSIATPLLRIGRITVWPSGRRSRRKVEEWAVLIALHKCCSLNKLFARDTLIRTRRVTSHYGRRDKRRIDFTIELCTKYPEAWFRIFADVRSVILPVVVPRAVEVLVRQLLLREQPLGSGECRHNHCHRDTECSCRRTNIEER